MNWNRYFSLSRFVWVLRRDFVENWKYNPRVLFTSFFMILMIYVMAMFAFSRISFSDNVLSSYIDFQKVLIQLGFSIQLLGMASHFMMHMKTKETRISNLMLPATSLEKFLARFLFVTIGCTVLFVIAAFLAEAVRFAIMPFFSGLPDGLKIFMLPELFKDFNIEPISAETIDPEILAQIKTNYDLFLIFVAILCSCLHALYVLGGNLFGKNAFLITTLVVFLLGYVGKTICLSINLGGAIDLESFEWIIAVVCLCLNVLIYYLSYKVFSRKQVVEPKFRLW